MGDSLYENGATTNTNTYDTADNNTGNTTDLKTPDENAENRENQPDTDENTKATAEAVEEDINNLELENDNDNEAIKKAHELMDEFDSDIEFECGQGLLQC